MNGQKRVARRLVLFVLAAVVALLAIVNLGNAQGLPGNARPPCDFTVREIDRWFEAGSAKRDGAVQPADSLNFNQDFHVPPNNRECNFLKWSSRMFLWLTSPTKGGGRVFESSEFYSASAA